MIVIISYKIIRNNRKMNIQNPHTLSALMLQLSLKYSVSTCSSFGQASSQFSQQIPRNQLSKTSNMFDYSEPISLQHSRHQYKDYNNKITKNLSKKQEIENDNDNEKIQLNLANADKGKIYKQQEIGKILNENKQLKKQLIQVRQLARDQAILIQELMSKLNLNQI